MQFFHLFFTISSKYRYQSIFCTAIISYVLCMLYYILVVETAYHQNAIWGSFYGQIVNISDKLSFFHEKFSFITILSSCNFGCLTFLTKNLVCVSLKSIQQEIRVPSMQKISFSPKNGQICMEDVVFRD